MNGNKDVLNIVWKAGMSVRAFDEKVPFEKMVRIQRPLVLGERIATTGLCSDLRVGTVIRIAEDGKTAEVDDGPCILYLDFDKDQDHEWTMSVMANKNVLEAWGKT